MSNLSFLPQSAAMKAEREAQRARISQALLERNKAQAAEHLLRIKLELAQQAFPQSIPGKR